MVDSSAQARRAAVGFDFWLRRLIAGVLGLVLLVVAGVVRARPVNHLDTWVAVQTHRFGLDHPAVVSVGRAVTVCGSATVLVPLVGLAVGLLVLNRRWGDALLCVVTAMLSSLLVRLAKAAFDRPRPQWSDPFATASGSAFPSGHATSAAAVYGVLALLLLPAGPGVCCRWPRAPRRLVGLAVALFVVAIGASRVLLGVHWFSDVIAGLALGSLLVVGAASVRPVRVPSASARSPRLG